MRRGDVVILGFPFKVQGSKVRPALVVQDDRDNRRLSATIVVLITGNLKHRMEPTFVFIDPATPEGVSSKLHAPSLVNCSHIYNVERLDVKHAIGRSSPTLMATVDEGLKRVLGLK